MEDETLETLKLGDVGRPINIRAIRKWNPRFGKHITSYVFVDKFGARIQAVVSGYEDQKFVERIIEIGNCYEIDKHVCAKPIQYINALAHKVNLRIGQSTTITPVDDDPEIPHHYFKFGNYETLVKICDDDTKTTDYCGVLQGKIEDKCKRDGSPFISFNIIDISNEIVHVALWEEIATSKDRFDREAIETTNLPVIIAITSAKVTTFSKRPSLQSTSNTFVFVNPQTTQTTLLLNRLEDANFGQINEPLQTSTISEILEKQTRELQGITLLCHAKIQQITSAIDWYQNICPRCSHEIFQYGKNWMCPTDGEFEKAVYMYRFSAKIEDNTGELDVAINHNPATTMIGVECDHLRIATACRTDYSIPAEIRSLKGKAMTFHIQAFREPRTGKMKATVHKVSNVEMQQTPTNAHTTSSTQHTPAPTTPQTSKMPSAASKRLDFTTESTSAEASKRHMQSR